MISLAKLIGVICVFIVIGLAALPFSPGIGVAVFIGLLAAWAVGLALY